MGQGLLVPEAEIVRLHDQIGGRIPHPFGFMGPLGS